MIIHKIWGKKLNIYVYATYPIKLELHGVEDKGQLRAEPIGKI